MISAVLDFDSWVLPEIFIPITLALLGFVGWRSRRRKP
jgi:hypothetical protein